MLSAQRIENMFNISRGDEIQGSINLKILRKFKVEPQISSPHDVLNIFSKS
mgnify:CR=1 FL=1